MRNVLNSQEDFVSLLIYLGRNNDQDNIKKYVDRLGHDYLNQILDKNVYASIEIISRQGLTDKAVKQLQDMIIFNKYDDILKIVEEQQPSSSPKFRM